MKTLTIAVAVLAASMTFAAPHGHMGPRPRHGPIPTFRPPPRPMPHYHSHHSLGWFWAGLGTGLLIDALRPTPPPPLVVVGPVVHQQVWVPPVYETRPILDAYGRVIRYEQVLVRPGYWQ